MQTFAPRKPSRFHSLIAFEAHHRNLVALVAAGIAFWVFTRWLRLPVNLVASWDVFALVSLGLAWIGMIYTDPRTRMKEAHLQDSGRAAIASCVVFAAVAGLFGAWVLLGSSKGLTGTRASLHIALAFFTVVVSWALVHTVLALHYAHICYHLAEQSKKHPPELGLIFPEESQPDFLDFAYFSFVIGMACQVSDVQVSSRRIRRIVLLHGLLSFGFNTVIVAMSLNLAASLL